MRVIGNFCCILAGKFSLSFYLIHLRVCDQTWSLVPDPASSGIWNSLTTEWLWRQMCCLEEDVNFFLLMFVLLIRTEPNLRHHLMIQGRLNEDVGQALITVNTFIASDTSCCI